MKKRLVCLLLCLCFTMQLCGCSASNNEYLVIENYVPTVQEHSSEDGKIVVKNYAGLRNALLELAYSGQTQGSIVFDSAYDGDTTEDMASACWAVRTQDALCAYCVENIAYELNKIVTINEASIYISYSDVTVSPEEIRHMSFSSGAEAVLKRSMAETGKRVVLLVEHSAYSAEDMANVITGIYRENPTIVPIEPMASVNMYSGSGSQRLYEISINYGLTAEELEERSAQLMAIDAFAHLDTESMSDMQLAYAAYDYLVDNCFVSGVSSENTAYSALVQKSANSEGMAFAYVELCRQLGVDCRIVYGQLDWHEHCWNIIKLDGSYYHVDVSAAGANGIEASFLKNDEGFWGLYRWDVASYPKCAGELEYSDLILS